MSKPEMEANPEWVAALTEVLTKGMDHKNAFVELIQNYQKEHKLTRDVACFAAIAAALDGMADACKHNGMSLENCDAVLGSLTESGIASTLIAHFGKVPENIKLDGYVLPPNVQRGKLN